MLLGQLLKTQMSIHNIYTLDQLLKKVCIILFLACTQIVLYLAIYSFSYTFWTEFVHKPSKVFGWIMVVWLSVYLFGFISLLSSIVYILRWKYRWIIITSLFLVFLLFFGRDISYTPYRSSLLVSDAFVSLFAPILILHLIIRVKNKRKSQYVSEFLIDSKIDRQE